MSKIKYGIKLRTSEIKLMSSAVKLIDRGIFDYVEMLINPMQLDIAALLEFNVEYVVHAPHETYGVDIGSLEKRDFTLKMIDFSLKCADKLNSNLVILHAGTDSAENAKKLLSDYDDSRIVLENMPRVGINGEACLGYSAEAMKALTGSKLGTCLDFGHAIKASISLKIDYKEIVQEFLKIKPKIFHISDGNFNTEKDEHLNIGAGVYDFKYFRNCIFNDSLKLATLETPRRNDLSLEEDIKNIETLRQLWSS